MTLVDEQINRIADETKMIKDSISALGSESKKAKFGPTLEDAVASAVTQALMNSKSTRERNLLLIVYRYYYTGVDWPRDLNGEVVVGYLEGNCRCGGRQGPLGAVASYGRACCGSWFSSTLLAHAGVS